MTAREGITRRGVLRSTAGAATAAVAAGAATGTAAAQTDFGGWFTDSSKGGATANYDGTTVDKTGQDSVTVTVGADGNGGTYAFAPPAVMVSPGTEVTFEWASDTHNVVVESTPDGADWAGHESIENSGFSFSHTFETEGVYKYYCEPHLPLGMKGAVVVDTGGGGGGGGGQAGVPANYGDWFTDSADGGAVGNFDGTTVDETGSDAVTVTVGADGNGGTYAFDPPALRVSPGTEVTFEWVSDTHNVLVNSQPDGADWAGHEGVENSGFSFSHTFETEGVYKYYCEPHLPLGMKGAIVVGAAPSGGGGGGGGDQGGVPAGSVDANPFWVSLFASVVTLAMLAPMIVSHYRRRGPEDVEYGGPSAADSTEKQAIPEAPAEEPAHELDHDDYDPVGTAALVVLYFLILVGMWVFMYFVEFLGNALTPMG